MFERALSFLLLCTGLLHATTALAEEIHLTPDSRWAELFENGQLAPGDEVVLHAGTYSDERIVRIRQRGSAGRPIVFRAVEGERVVITRPTDGPRQNVILIEGCQYVTLRGLEITGGSSGIRMHGHGGRPIRFVTIEDCHVHHVGNAAITANRPGNRYEGVILRRNHVHDTAGVGEAFYLGVNNNKGQFFDGIIEGNYIHHLNGPDVEQGDGIELKHGSYNNIVRDNVIHHTNCPGITVYGTVGKAPNIVERNVIWATRDHAIQVASDAIVRNNVIFGTRSDGIHSQNHQGAIPGNLTIVGNTVRSDRAGIRVTQPAGGRLSGPIVIANNAIYQEGGQAISLPGVDGFTLAANVGVGRANPRQPRDRWSPIGEVTRDFADLKGRNAHLRSGSALAGAADPAYLPEDDFDAQPRGDTRDVGAYAYRGQEDAEAIRDDFKR